MSRAVFIGLFAVAILASYMTLYEAFMQAPNETTWPMVSPGSQNESQRNPAAINKASFNTQELEPHPQSSADTQPLTELRDRLEQQEQRLSFLRRAQAERIQQINIINPYLMNQKSYDLEDLQDQIEQNKANQNVLHQITQENLIAQEQQNTLMRDELDLAISELVASVQNIQLQFDYSITSPEITTGIAKEQHFKDLRNTLALQVEQLNALRTQRASLSQSLSVQNQALASQIQQQRNDLQQEQMFLQEQIFFLRKEIRDLQVDQRQTNMSLIPLEQQIQQAEEDYQALTKQLNSLSPTSNH